MGDVDTLLIPCWFLGQIDSYPKFLSTIALQFSWWVLYRCRLHKCSYSLRISSSKSNAKWRCWKDVAMKMNDQDNDDQLYRNFKTFIRYHQVIWRFIKHFCACYSLVFATNLVYSAANLTLVLLAINSGDRTASAVMQLVTVFLLVISYLYLYCYIGEVLYDVKKGETKQASQSDSTDNRIRNILEIIEQQVTDAEWIQHRYSVDPQFQQSKQTNEEEMEYLYLPYISYPFAPHYWFRWVLKFQLCLYTRTGCHNIDTIYDSRVPYSVASSRIADLDIYRKLRNPCSTMIPYLEKTAAIKSSNAVTFRATRVPDRSEATPKYEMVINCLVTKDLADTSPSLILGRNFAMQYVFQVQLFCQRLQLARCLEATVEYVPFDIYQPAEKCINEKRDKFNGWEEVYDKKCGDVYAPRPNSKEMVELPNCKQ
ncbi:hypothetical protein U1Q18_051178 [Sarracenia purpurea var. burkii]